MIYCMYNIVIKVSIVNYERPDLVLGAHVITTLYWQG